MQLINTNTSTKSFNLDLVDPSKSLARLSCCYGIIDLFVKRIVGLEE